MIRHFDKQAVRLLDMDDIQNVNGKSIEEKMCLLHPFSSFAQYLKPSEEEWLESCVRRQQLYKFCSKANPIHVDKFERAMRQYVFESLPLESTTDTGAVVEPETVEDQLEKIISRYDHPYCDMQTLSSSSVIGREASEQAKETVTLRDLSQHCCLERFEPNLLLQVSYRLL